jgi:hypothetical protein
MQDTSMPHKGWLNGSSETPSPTRLRSVIQRPQVFGFIVALSLLLTYICAPWMG